MEELKAYEQLKKPETFKEEDLYGISSDIRRGVKGSIDKRSVQVDRDTVRLSTLNSNSGDALIYDKGTGLYTNVPFYSGVARNAIINGGMRFAQRGTSITSINDDTYGLDRWNVLSDGNGIVNVSRSSSAPTGLTASMLLAVATANKKFGVLQFVENSDALTLIGGYCGLSFWLKTTTSKVINNVKVAIISWDGSANNLTSDVVSAWGAAGTDPTLAANWTYEVPGVNITPNTVWKQYFVDKVLIDTASATNIGVFIWCDDTDSASSDELYVTGVNLSQGRTSLSYINRPMGVESELCRRFYEKTYNTDVTPGTATATGAWFTQVFNSATADGSSWVGMTHPKFQTRKIKNPTVTLYDTSGNANQWTIGGAATACAAGNISHTGFTVNNNTGGPATPSADRSFGHFVADSEL